MDFLDPKKQRRHNILMVVGYVCIGVAILLGTRLLLEIGHGYGLDKEGQVIQRGLLYVSSVPAGANISLNKTDTQSKTNTRLSPISGQYTLELSRTGYHSWQQTLSLDGGTIMRYNYPFLFPTTLRTTPVSGATYTAEPALVAQSPNLRWLLVQQPTDSATFDEYDLNNPKTKPTALRLPDALAPAGKTQNLTVVEWAADNQHILLKRTDDAGKVDFLMFDRNDPAQSVNLNTALNANPTNINLAGGKYNEYYLYDAAAHTLGKASLANPAVVPLLDSVLQYKAQGSNTILYVSDHNVAAGKVAINLFQDGKTYTLRTVNANGTYLLQSAQYGGSWYVAVGAAAENKVYVYKNPVNQLNSKTGLLVPIFVLKTTNPNYVVFSANARFVMSENGSNFAVYDAENDEGYAYDTKTPLDAPQQHATWMDGHRLQYVSGSKLVVFDFDHANQQTLMPASPNLQPFYDPDYKFVDAFAPSTTTPGQTSFTSTALRTPADQ